MKTLELVVPFFNPSPGVVEAAVKAFREFQKTLPEWQAKLILVDDGSAVPTGLPVVGDVEMARYPENRGKGYALRHGISFCKTDRILYTDIDFPYTFQGMAAVLASLEDGADVALGYRAETYYQQVPWFRKQLSRTFRFVLKNLLKSEVTDTQCGLKGMNKKGREIFLQTRIDRFLVDMEFVRLCSSTSGLTIKGVPVQLRKDVVFSRMGVRTLIKEAGNFLKLLAR